MVLYTPYKTAYHYALTLNSYMWITKINQREQFDTGMYYNSHIQWQMDHAMTVTTVLVYIPYINPTIFPNVLDKYGTLSTNHCSYIDFLCINFFMYLLILSCHGAELKDGCVIIIGLQRKSLIWCWGLMSCSTCMMKWQIGYMLLIISTLRPITRYSVDAIRKSRPRLWKGKIRGHFIKPKFDCRPGNMANKK